MQGRGPGESMAPASLVELISSIATVGVLQPILVEELPDAGVRLVSGERRLRAVLWGASHHPENSHFTQIPAVVCPGPLSEEERRCWQLVENLAREDLKPAELAAALLFERAAVLTTRLLAAGVPVPAPVAYLDDPVERFRALDRLRTEAGCHHLGAPWGEVLRRLGLQLREEKAKALVRAFSALPQDLSAEMDAAEIALATRLAYLKLNQGRAQAAAELWEAIKARGRPDLLAAAIREQTDHPDIDPEAAVDAAEALHESADEARALAGRQRYATEDEPPSVQPVSRQLVDAALRGLKDLLEAMRAGTCVSRYDTGSLELFAIELLELLGAPAKAEAVA
ncbi:MAG: ParB/RepB/Spo0J family partition protein [Acidimicrobiales bacterium]